jgi:hypothetical protein
MWKWLRFEPREELRQLILAAHLLIAFLLLLFGGAIIADSTVPILELVFYLPIGFVLLLLGSSLCENRIPRLHMRGLTMALGLALLCTCIGILRAVLLTETANAAFLTVILALAAVGFARRDRIQVTPIGLVWTAIKSRWRFAKDALDGAVARASIADPLTKWLQVRHFQGPLLYATVLLVIEIAMVGNLVMVSLAVGAPRHFIIEAITLRSQPIMLASAAAFPFAIMQVSRLERLFVILEDRLKEVKAASRWQDFPGFMADVSLQYGRIQGRLFRWVVYLIAFATVFAVLAGVSLAFGADSTNPEIHEWETSVGRGIPIVVTLWIAVVLALCFLYYVALVTLRALLAARWLRRASRSFYFTIDEEEKDGFGGFRPIQNYVLGMVVLPLVFSLWTTFIVYRGMRLEDTTLGKELMDMAPYYAFEVALVVAGVLIPFWLGHRIMSEAKRARFTEIDAGLSEIDPLSDRHKLLRLQREKVEALPDWPLSLRQLPVVLSVGVIMGSAILQVATRTVGLPVGTPELGLGLSFGMTAFAVVDITAGALKH